MESAPYFVVTCKQCRKAGTTTEFQTEGELEAHLQDTHGLVLHKEARKQGAARDFGSTNPGLFARFIGKQVSIVLCSGKKIDATLVELSTFDLLLEDDRKRRVLCPKHAVELVVLRQDVAFVDVEGRGN